MFGFLICFIDMIKLIKNDENEKRTLFLLSELII